MDVKRLSCGSCISCPFVFTEESEQAQNYGCLPTVSNIVNMHKEHNVNWACHYDANRVCSGFATMFKDEYLSKLVEGMKFNKNLPLVDYEEWYQKGQEEAVRLAKERWGTNEWKTKAGKPRTY